MPDPCAHVGFAFLLCRLVWTVLPVLLPLYPDDIQAWAVVWLDATIVLASLLPDLVDKALFVLKLTVGTRTIGHTLLFLLACTCGAWYVAELHVLHQSFVLPILVGLVSHLLADCCFGYGTCLALLRHLSI